MREREREREREERERQKERACAPLHACEGRLRLVAVDYDMSAKIHEPTKYRHIGQLLLSDGNQMTAREPTTLVECARTCVCMYCVACDHACLHAVTVQIFMSCYKHAYTDTAAPWSCLVRVRME
jgi:hypothetical protein